MKGFVFILGALLTVPAHAQAGAEPIQAETMQADKGPILWNDLYAGMSKAEFKAKYPKIRSYIYGDCKVEVIGNFKRGGLRRVVLLHNGKSKECFGKIQNDIKAKFGEPESQTDRTNLTPIPILTSSTTFIHQEWEKDGVYVTLARLGGTVSFNAFFSIDAPDYKVKLFK